MTRETCHSYLEPIKSKPVEKGPFPFHLRWPGRRLDRRNLRHVPSQGSLVCFLWPFPRISPYSRSLADATPGEMTPRGFVRHFLLGAGSRETGSEGTSRCFSDNGERHNVYNSPWIAVVMLNRNKDGKSCLIWQHVRLII